MTFKDDLVYRQRIHDTREAALAEYAEHGIDLGPRD
jgi:hypothetical protein